MPIVEGTQPSPVHVTGGATTGTTNAFIPESGALLVLLVAADGANVTSATTVVVTDSLGGTWTLLKRQNTFVQGPPDVGGSAEVWVRDSPGVSMTVTGTWTSTNGGPDGDIVVRTLIGALPAAQQTGATGGSGGTSVPPSVTLTPTQIGSRIYGAGLRWVDNATLTPNANTVDIDQFNDAGVGDTWTTFKSSADTTSLTSTTYGYTNANSEHNVAAAEILAAPTGSRRRRDRLFPPTRWRPGMPPYLRPRRSFVESAAAGPGTFTATADDTAAATDVATRTLITARTAAENAATADTILRALTQTRTTADTAAATETAVRAALTLARTASDTAVATDAATRTSVRTRTTADTASAADTAIGQFGIARTAADTAAATDTAVRGAQTFTRATTDAAAGDTATRTSSRARTTADTATATDTASRALTETRTATDTAAATDTATRAALTRARTTSDTAAATDTAVGTVGGGQSRAATDTASATDTAARAAAQRTRAAADTATAVDVATRLVARARTAADAALGADTAVKAFIRLPQRSTTSAALSADAASRAWASTRAAADTAAAVDVAVGLLVAAYAPILTGLDNATTTAGNVDGAIAGSLVEGGTVTTGLVG